MVFERRHTKVDFGAEIAPASAVFGKYAFRRKNRDGHFGKINKPLFEVVSVCFARLSIDEQSRIKERKDAFLKMYDGLLEDDKFVSVITSGTANLNSVKQRYNLVEGIIRSSLKGVLNYD